jgi:hypothetical protein
MDLSKKLKIKLKIQLKLTIKIYKIELVGLEMRTNNLRIKCKEIES